VIINWLTDNLSDVLAREVDVVPYVENCEMGYVHMEALLTTKTIWGDASWLVASRDSAEKTLREGYTRTKNAREIWLRVRETVLSDVIREHEELCRSILEDVSTIMDLIKAPEPFYSEIRRMAVNLAVNEKAIRAYLQDRRNGQVALNIRTVLSNRENVFGLQAILGAAERTFRRAGLVELSGDSAEGTAVEGASWSPVI